MKKPLRRPHPLPRPRTRPRLKTTVARRVAGAAAPPHTAPPAPPPAVATPSIPPPIPPPAPARHGLSLRGEYWDVRYEGRQTMVEDCRGLRYIAVLITTAAAGGGPVHAKELVALATGEVAAAIEMETRQDVLDPVARRRILARLEELTAARDAAAAADDLDRAAALDAEYERIADELGRAARGARRGATFSDAGEKARKAVAKAISEAIARIAACDGMDALAAHLTKSVRKGQWLSYGSADEWTIDFHPPRPRK